MQTMQLEYTYRLRCSKIIVLQNRARTLTHSLAKRQESIFSHSVNIELVSVRKYNLIIAIGREADLRKFWVDTIVAQDYVIILFMLGLWAYSIHLILR